MTIGTLISDYPGDAAWVKFAFAHGASEATAEIVAAAVVGPSYAIWMSQSIPAFEDRSPNYVLACVTGGELAVRTMLMRLP